MRSGFSKRDRAWRSQRRATVSLSLARRPKKRYFRPETRILARDCRGGCLSRERVHGVIARAWRDGQPLESWQPRARIYRFAPSARAGHVIYDALRETYSDIPADVCPKMAAAALARYTRRDLTGNNIGRKTIAELERWLASFELTFAGEEEPIWWT